MSSFIWQRISPRLYMTEIINWSDDKVSFSIIATTKEKWCIGRQEARLGPNLANIRNKSTNNRGRKVKKKKNVNEGKVYCYLGFLPGTHTHKYLSPRVPCLNHHSLNVFGNWILLGLSVEPPSAIKDDFQKVKNMPLSQIWLEHLSKIFLIQ